MWLQWFKTAGSGVEWPELATVNRECRQLYEQYKGEEWVHPFDVHFAPVDPSLEFLMDDLMVGMMVSTLAVASTSNTAKHLAGALAVVRGEGWSKGCGSEEAANCGDIQEAGSLTPKAAAGGVTRGLATTLRSKGKGKGKAQDKEDKDIEDQIEETFTDKCLAALLCWQKALTVVDTGLGAGVKLEKAKGKVTVSLEKQQEYKRTHGVCNNCWADNDPEGCWYPTREVTSGSSRGAKVKSKEWVESDEDGGNNGNNHNNDNKVPLAQKQVASPAPVASAKRPQTVAREEGEGDVEMRETTPLVTVAEVEQEASGMEVEGEEEFEAAPATIKADKEEERIKEVEVQRWGTWSDTPLHQVGDDKLEWLGEDLGWLTPLTSAALLADFDKRVAGVEQRFQRELEAAREELLAAWACYAVAKRTLATLAGYWEGDWEEVKESVEVPDNNADLDS
ncbi:hypothetical protein C0989_002179 [Termitomyces sp. Mn162]|nr:hypothetical protein C0989_002179 [Termitomyces sp. Mn162]